MKLVKKTFLSAIMLVAMMAFVACGNESDTNTENTESTEMTESAQPTSMDMDGNPQAQALTDTQRDATPQGPTTVMSFRDGMIYDYGTIDAGTKVNHTFKFKNTGSEPLIISNCKGSCGCTVPKCPTEPIAPGEEGEIPVEFDSKGKNGADSKSVTITANTNPSATVLTIRGTVKGQPGQAPVQVQ